MTHTTNTSDRIDSAGNRRGQGRGRPTESVFGSFRMGDCAVLCEDFRLCNNDPAAVYLRGPAVAVDLNETAVEILRRCQEPRQVQCIVDDLVALYVGAPSEEIERSVREFLDSALCKGWVRRSSTVA